MSIADLGCYFSFLPDVLRLVNLLEIVYFNPSKAGIFFVLLEAEELRENVLGEAEEKHAFV